MKLGGKRLVSSVITGLVLASGFFVATEVASARQVPVVYQVARAVPTKSGELVRVTLFTKFTKNLKVRVNDGPRVRASRFGRGCGERRCVKWKIYAPRTPDNECYELTYASRNANAAVAGNIMVCEPFPDGRV